jgi:hypothetical protein
MCKASSARDFRQVYPIFYVVSSVLKLIFLHNVLSRCSAAWGGGEGVKIKIKICLFPHQAVQVTI